MDSAKTIKRVVLGKSDVDSEAEATLGCLLISRWKPALGASGGWVRRRRSYLALED